MTPQQSKLYKDILISIIVTLAFILIITLFHKGCNTPTIQLATRDSIITKIDTLKVHDKVLVEKWHKAIHTTDSIVKLVYFSAPDTCDTYINEVVNVYQNERDSVSAVVNSKDSIITQYSALSKSDSVSISILSDSISKHKCRRLKAWLKGFGAGYVSGYGTGVIINNLK